MKEIIVKVRDANSELVTQLLEERGAEVTEKNHFRKNIPEEKGSRKTRKRGRHFANVFVW